MWNLWISSFGFAHTRAHPIPQTLASLHPLYPHPATGANRWCTRSALHRLRCPSPSVHARELCPVCFRRMECRPRYSVLGVLCANSFDQTRRFGQLGGWGAARCVVPCCYSRRTRARYAQQQLLRVNEVGPLSHVMQQPLAPSWSPGRPYSPLCGGAAAASKVRSTRYSRTIY